MKAHWNSRKSYVLILAYALIALAIWEAWIVGSILAVVGLILLLVLKPTGHDSGDHIIWRLLLEIVWIVGGFISALVSWGILPALALLIVYILGLGIFLFQGKGTENQAKQNSL